MEHIYNEMRLAMFIISVK